MTMCGRVGRSRIRARLTNVPQCLIGIEAGMATHHVARELIALGQRQAAAAGLRQAVSPNQSGHPRAGWPPCRILLRTISPRRLLAVGLQPQRQSLAPPATEEP